jgi:sarcosine oxidase subunit beta
MNHASENDTLPKGCEILIIGGGAYGLSSAWFLASKYPGKDIVVVDASDFAGNGTGRCIGGFRTQWGHESNIRMCLESVDFFEKAKEILSYPQGIELKQEGYLLLAWDEENLERFRTCQIAQHAHGVKSRMLSREEVLRISPKVNRDGLLGGAICERDGTVSPFRLLDALLKGVRREGVRVKFGCSVRSLEHRGDTFKVSTSHGQISAKKVVVCTDWAAPDLVSQLGLTVPVDRLPVEIMVTEAAPRMLGPIHISMQHGMAINQMPRGSIVVNHGRARQKSDDISNQPDWFAKACRGACEVVPALADLNVLRGWAGTISVTPDMQPIIDELDVPGLYVAISAYKGLMTAPAAGRLISDLVAGTAQHDPMAKYVALSRFESGDLIREPMTNGAKVATAEVATVEA